MLKPSISHVEGLLGTCLCEVMYYHSSHATHSLSRAEQPSKRPPPHQKRIPIQSPQNLDYLLGDLCKL
jgi:hypothetical protein